MKVRSKTDGEFKTSLKTPFQILRIYQLVKYFDANIGEDSCCCWLVQTKFYSDTVLEGLYIIFIKSVL